MPRLSKIGAAALAAFGWTAGATVSASYLVVAGGGGGGSQRSGGGSGGGGAGGYRTGTASLNPTLSYTVTVGAGGVGTAGGNPEVDGGLGSDSVFNAITSTGGGGGGKSSTNGTTGGSGGGGGSNTGTGGAGNTPSTSPSQGNNGGNAASIGGGGGGGASAVGSANTTNRGGNGGAGTASSITGSSVTYAGGGGGGGESGGGGAPSSGGAGGGGAGGIGPAGNGVSGTANLGGGGGGGSGNNASPGGGGSGGSGIVIISYPAPQKFGGGVVTTSGSNVIHTFNTSGTLSPLSSLTASYLIVAGGGSGGTDGGGGGGAGGLLSGTGLTIDSNSIYLVTVGAGGAAPGIINTVGIAGGNSAFSMVTTTAVGGGYGGAYNGLAGGAGGSGGGGGSNNTNPSATVAGGSGTSGQGNAGGNGGRQTAYVGGGGGGAGAVGGTVSTGSVAGNGGIGVQWPASSGVYYAGGGGGGASSGTAGTGGSGGGGNGSLTSGVAYSGTANTGGGGGGGEGAGTGTTSGAGGSGVVIISYAGSTQQMAGGTVTITGGNVIHTFTSSGYLTPIKYVNNSLRFRSSASAYLNRTPASAGNRQIFTISAWVKRGQLATSSPIMGAGASSSTEDRFMFAANDTFLFDGYSSGSTVFSINTTAVYRDPASWYYFVVGVDTTQATASNRIKLYVNGVQITSFVTATYPAQNASLNINNNVVQYVGRTPDPYNFDGYLTEINFIDGQQLTPNSFGTFNSYGVWQPITYGGSYGTNGFYLNFSDNSNNTAATIGKDYSGNGNNWTPNNISVTSGVTYDSMVDSPTVSATSSNYAVANPLNNTAGYLTISGGNLNVSCGYADKLAFGTFAIPTSGKWYFEYLVSSTGSATQVGLGDNTQSQSSGTGFSGGSQKFGSGGSWANSDIAGVAIDMDAGTGTIYKNNSSYLSLTSLSGTTWYPCVYINSANGSFNFGQRPFSYTPPTGFVALNTYNLPASTITNGAAYMAATLYTGSSNASTGPTQSITGVGFQPDFVWIKARNSASPNHAWYDSVRGATKFISSSLTGAEQTYSDSLTSFNSNGFSLGIDANAIVNYNAYNYVAWQWKAGTTSASNTNGTITSTVSANTTAGFSVATWTGLSSGVSTIGHGLGVAPSMIIVKSRSSADNWFVYHVSTGNTGKLNLNDTSAFGTVALWNNTSPTSTVFTFNNSTVGSAQNYVTYSFAAVAGYSAFGSYTGNGSADGPFVYTGFRPRFVMYKRTDSTGDWAILDTSRDSYNVEQTRLFANNSNADTTGVTSLDGLSNGFKIRDLAGSVNASGGTYIYACFAETAFKFSNAR